MRLLFAICVMWLNACGTYDHLLHGASVDDRLLVPTQEFLEGCRKHVDNDHCVLRWQTVDEVTVVRGWVNGVKGRAGLCTAVNTASTGIKLKRTIHIMGYYDNGNPVPDYKVKQVLFHELGHCILDLRHEDTKLMETNRPLISKKVLDRSWEDLKSAMWEVGRARLD